MRRYSNIIVNKPRLFFTLGSFAATLAVYILYAHVFVPILLPAKERPDNISDIRQPPQNEELLGLIFPGDSWVFEGTDMFQLAESNGMVLCKESKILENNQLWASPCAVLWFPENSEKLTPEEKYRQAIVLEVSDHALLELNGGFSSANLQLKHGQLNGQVTIRSKMKKLDASDDIELITSDVLFDNTQIRTQQQVKFRFGRNNGYGQQLTIEMAHTDKSKKGQTPNTIKRIELHDLGELRLYVENDDLTRATAQNNNSSNRREHRVEASTANDVLTHRAAYPQANRPTGGFQLRSETVGGTNTTGTNSTAGNANQSGMPFQMSNASSSTQTQQQSQPGNLSEVLVVCQGIVDMVADTNHPSQWLLTFRNKVDVIRTNPLGGATDQLNCQELILTFGPKDGSAMPQSNAAGETNPLANFGEMAPLRVKAIGTPVIARSPENKGFQAVGRELDIDLIGKKLSLTQGEQISVLYDNFNIKGKGLYYAVDDDGPGMLDMPGAGTLEGMAGTNKDKHLKLEWNDELKMLPDDENPLLTVLEISGKPKASIGGIGNASADKVFIFCDMRKKPNSSGGTSQTLAGANGKMNVDIQKLVMQNNVILKTDTGEIITNRLEMTFQPTNALASTATPNAQHHAATQSTTYIVSKPVQSSKNGLTAMSIFGQTDGSKSSYTVRCDKVDVLARTVGKDTVVDQILLTGNVQLDERPAVAGAEPINVSGQTVRITDPDTMQMKINILGDANVLGGHAVFQGRGVILMGANINIDREKNLFFVDGKGELRVSQQVSSSATSGNSAGAFRKLFSSTSSSNAGNQSVIISWDGSMEFNGKELLFLKNVDVNYSMMAINKSELIRVYLTKPFYFFEKNNAEIEPERIVIRGDIDLERDTFADNGGQQSHDKIRLTEIEILPLTGIFKGKGPGYVSSIFVYDGESASGLMSGTATATRTATTGGTVASSNGNGLFNKGLKFIQCNFNGSVEGNYKTGQIRFLDRVVVMLCPARSFRDTINTANTRTIVANGMLLECNTLEINQMQQGINAAKTLDLKAEGNSLIEMTYDNRYYLANAEKIKFDQAKTLFTLEGNRNSSVELYEAASLNSPMQKRMANERIFLNPVTKEIRVDGLSGSLRGL